MAGLGEIRALASNARKPANARLSAQPGEADDGARTRDTWLGKPVAHRGLQNVFSRADQREQSHSLAHRGPRSSSAIICKRADGQNAGRTGSPSRCAFVQRPRWLWRLGPRGPPRRSLQERLRPNHAPSLVRKHLGHREQRCKPAGKSTGSFRCLTVPTRTARAQPQAGSHRDNHGPLSRLEGEPTNEQPRPPRGRLG